MRALGIHYLFRAFLRNDNPYGRCVWHCDNSVVDHQSVVMEYEEGCLANHNLVTGTSRPCRIIHIVGTMGEIQGVLRFSKPSVASLGL